MQIAVCRLQIEDRRLLNAVFSFLVAAKYLKQSMDLNSKPNLELNLKLNLDPNMKLCAVSWL